MSYIPLPKNIAGDAVLVEQKAGTSSTVDDGDLSLTVDTDKGPIDVRMLDGDGNPLSSTYDPNTNSHILDIHDADIHNGAVNRYLHQHGGTTTTISTASAVNDYIINVANTAGLIVGDSLHINTGSVEFTHPEIIAVGAGSPGTLTLDRRLDQAHDIGDEVTNAVIDLASQIGTLAAPQLYAAWPEPGEIWHITNLTLAMGHGTAGDFGLFGNIAALTNGVVVRVRINGNYGTLTNWKTNGDINVDTGEVSFHTRSSGGGTFGTAANGAFKARTGAVMRLDGSTNDQFEIYVQDDLTTLDFWNMKVQGHLEGS